MKLTQRPRTILGAALVLYIIYYGLFYGAKIDSTAIGLAAFIFLVWSIVAGIQAMIRTRRSKKASVGTTQQ